MCLLCLMQKKAGQMMRRFLRHRRQLRIYRLMEREARRPQLLDPRPVRQPIATGNWQFLRRGNERQKQS